MGMAIVRQTMKTRTKAGLPHNKSVNSDPQLQEAAAPQGLWSGYRQRYAA
jgi:hypothetical protein